MNIVLLVIGVVAAILGIIIRVLTKDTDYEKDGKHYAHPMIIGGLILLVFSQSFAIIPTGYTGVRITFGQIDNRTVQNGFNWKIPFVQSINQVNNKQQDISYTGQVWSETAERTVLYYEGITVTYTINPEKSAWIYANVSDYKKNLISDNLVASAIKSSSKELNSTDATNRGIIEPIAQEKIQELYQTKEKLIKELHREPTLKEISSDTGISEKLLKEYEAQQGIRIVGSLDAPINLEKEESETFGDFIADTDQNIEEIAEQKELEELILQCLDNLTDKEKSVIKMRFGFNGEEPMTLEAVGNQLGVTRERIRQIEAKSIRKLRNYKTRLLLEDYIPKK